MTVDIMLDLETMDNTPTSAIISIGAVAFHRSPQTDPETGATPEIIDTFYTQVSLVDCMRLGLTVSASTIMWWMQQSDDARAAFKDNDKAPVLAEALARMSVWVNTHITDDSLVWGNGADFDNAIARNAYNKLYMPLPWKFWQNACYRTVKNLNPDIKFKRVGVYHNPVDDARSQAYHLISILRRNRDA